MKIHFINVGYGEAILVQSEDKNILVDTGSGRKEAYQQPGAIPALQYLQAIGVTDLDVLIITHIHEDHIGGAASVVMHMPIGEIWLGMIPDGSFTPLLRWIYPLVAGKENGSLFWYGLQGYEQLMTAAQAKKIAVQQVFDADRRQVGQIPVRFYGPAREKVRQVQLAYEKLAQGAGQPDSLHLYYALDKSCNADSLAVQIGSERAGALLTGDKVGDWQEIAAANCLHTPVLKAAHHGQKDGMPQALLTGADPDVVVVCADAGRTFDSAHPEILGRADGYLNARGRNPRVYVTGLLGTTRGIGSALVINARRDGEGSVTAEIWPGGGGYAGA